MNRRTMALEPDVIKAGEDAYLAVLKKAGSKPKDEDIVRAKNARLDAVKAKVKEKMSALEEDEG